MPADTPTQWIASCAVQLQARWRTVAAADLEEVAVELWRDPQLRALPPQEAAARWLAPISPEVRDERAAP